MLIQQELLSVDIAHEKKPHFLTREFLMIRSFKSQLSFHAPSRPEERLSPASEARRQQRAGEPDFVTAGSV